MRSWILVWAALTATVTAQEGSIGGRVIYVGRQPPPVYVFESGSNQRLLAVDPDQGLGAAVVYVAAGPGTPVEDAPEIVVNQKNWWFTPGVVAVRSGQPVRFTNDDSSNHNVRSSGGVPANRFSAYTGTGDPYVHRFRPNREYAPVVLSCDIHAWMMAWVYVFDHPHFTVTATTGAFEIPGLAPATYRLSVRHGPGGLARDVDVIVAAGQQSRVDVAFDTADLNLPTR